MSRVLQVTSPVTYVCYKAHLFELFLFIVDSRVLLLAFQGSVQCAADAHSCEIE